MSRCPICRGRINDEHQCKRCGADLVSVNQIENQAGERLSQAIKDISDNKLAHAEQLLEQVLTLKRSDFAQNILAFVQKERKRIHKSGVKKTTY